MEEEEKNENEIENVKENQKQDEKDFQLPQTWDHTLEKFLETPVDQYMDFKEQKFQWTNQTLHNYSRAPTFVAAINGVKKKKIVVPPAKVGILQTKEDMIRKIILKPLSPRKPDVIPGSKQLVKQRDKYGIENIVQQRNRRHILSSLQPLPELLQPVPVETQRSSTSSLCSVRHFTIPRKETLNQIYY